MRKSAILSWLREDDPDYLDDLYHVADCCRRDNVGDSVHLRGLVEISNNCVRNCCYCGLRRDNPAVARYRMTAEEIMACAREAVKRRYGSLVLQAGEDYALMTKWVAELISRIKAETPLAVTLGLGERPVHELEAWKEAGADRYLLKFETSDPALYRMIHPPMPDERFSRKDLLRILKDIGYETGSGVMIGIPGQSFESLAEDLLLFRDLDLDMIGVGPFIPHPDTPLGNGELVAPAPAGEQVPNTADMTYKFLAITRVLCPDTNLPATTALTSISSEQGRELALRRGANVIMPTLTPARYRKSYEIYPHKRCFSEDSVEEHLSLGRTLSGLGRSCGRGRGSRRRSGGGCTITEGAA